MRGVRVTQFEDLTEPDGKYAYWAGVIGFEEKTTGDSRIIEKGALRLDTLPVPFRWSRKITVAMMARSLSGQSSM